MADTSLAQRSGIYEIVNTVNGKRYVGSAVRIAKRWAEHRRSLKRKIHHARFLQRSWTKYGPHSFDFRVLEAVEDIDQLLEREQHYIDTLKPEYNSAPTAGSSLGVRWGDEAKRKKSAQTKAYFDKNPEARARLSQANTGKPSPLKGVPLSPEHRAKFVRKPGWSHDSSAKEKIAAASKKAWGDQAYREKNVARSKEGFTPEIRAGLSEKLRNQWTDPAYRAKVVEASNRADAIEKNRAAALARWQDPEYREKVCSKLKGRKPHNKGKPISDEQKAKHSAAMRRKCEDPEYRRMISEATKAAMKRPELRAKLANVHTGRKQSAETVAKRVLANTGKVRTPEQCAALSARTTAFYAKKRLEKAPQ